MPEEIRHKQAWGKPPGPEPFLWISHRATHSPASLPPLSFSPCSSGWLAWLQTGQMNRGEGEEPGQRPSPRRPQTPSAWVGLLSFFFNLLLNRSSAPPFPARATRRAWQVPQEKDGALSPSSLSQGLVLSKWLLRPVSARHTLGIQRRASHQDSCPRGAEC